MAFVLASGLVPWNAANRPPSTSLCKLNSNGSHIAACTGPTCKLSNSANILLILQELCSTTEDISVEAVGCLGECGNGPNVGVTSHGATPRIRTGIRSLHDALDLLHSLGHTPSNEILEPLKNKERGDKFLSAGDAHGAVQAYDSAVCSLQSRPRLLARVLCNRSVALREIGLGKEALEDANEAVGIETGLAGAWKRKAEAHELLKHTEMAVQAWKMWGRLAGTTDEAARKVKKLQGWRFAVFGR